MALGLNMKDVKLLDWVRAGGRFFKRKAPTFGIKYNDDATKHGEYIRVAQAIAHSYGQERVAATLEFDRLTAALRPSAAHFSMLMRMALHGICGGVNGEPRRTPDEFDRYVVSFLFKLYNSVTACAEHAGSMELLSLDLSGYNLRGAKLRRIYFKDCRFDDAIMEGASLEGASFIDCSLVEANLAGANMMSCDFTGSDLSRANLFDTNALKSLFVNARLNGANLSYANFRRTNLSGADLTGTNCLRVNLGGALIEGAIGAPDAFMFEFQQSN